MARRIEDAIQEQLILWLKAEHPDVTVHYNKNEGKKTMATAMKDKRMGLKAGRTDLDLDKKVRSIKHYLHLEIKRIGGRLTLSQKEYHAEFIPAANDKLEVGYGLEQCKEIITNWLQSLK